jgi:hypothetical protein
VTDGAGHLLQFRHAVHELAHRQQRVHSEKPGGQQRSCCRAQDKKPSWSSGDQFSVFIRLVLRSRAAIEVRGGIGPAASSIRPQGAEDLIR